MSECDSSDQAVSVVVDVVGVNFLVFRLLLSNRCTDLLQILCGCSLGGPLQGASLIFHGIMGNFVQFLANSKKIFLYQTTDQKSFIFSFESPQGVLFLVCSN